MVNSIRSDLGKDIIFDELETSSEVIFRFKASSMDKLEKYLNPKTFGADISPFSKKNLPKNKDYKIPDEELSPYHDIVKKLGQNRIIELTHMTRKFIQSMINKKRSWNDIKADMALKGLSGKNYIHAIGKWDEYLTYINDNLELDSHE